MEETVLPPGWGKHVNKDGRIFYSSPPGPNCVKIYSKSELKGFHKKGRFWDISEEKLVFTSKRKPKQKNYMKPEKKSCLDDREVAIDNVAVNGADVEMLRDGGDTGFSMVRVDQEHISMWREESDNSIAVVPNPENIGDENTANAAVVDSESATISSKERAKLEREEAKIREAVLRLTIDADRKINHKDVLENAAKRLSEVRLGGFVVTESLNIATLKDMVNSCNTEDDMTRVLCQNPWFQSKFSHLFTSQLLEQLLSLSSTPGNPLKSFPVDVNRNVYADVVHFAIDNAPDVILLLTSLTKKFESPISSSDIISLAFSFSSLAEAASSLNKAVKKTKTVCLRSSGLTNSGLDAHSPTGAVETSRSFRNCRDFTASISEEVLKQYAKKSVAQFTFDNLDIQINKVSHHLTLNILEFEQTDTSGLNTDVKTREEMLSYFSPEFVFLKSEKNKELFEHYQFVTVVALAELLGREVIDMEWLLTAAPKHYKHKDSENARRKSLLFIDKPMYYQETKNSDMFKIMDSLQLKYLKLIGEHAEHEYKYAEDLKLILSVDCADVDSEAAEKRVKKEVLDAGELIREGFNT